MTDKKRPPDPIADKVRDRIGAPGNTPGEDAAAKAALERLERRGRRPKRRVQSKLVTASCQYPCDHPPHTFQYVKTTKPQVYCPGHRVGWDIENDIGDVVGHHGGERLVRVARDSEGAVVSRRLVFESQRSDAEVNAELYAAEKAGSSGRLHHQRGDGPAEGDGLMPTTGGIVTGRNGKPRFDPTLWRTLKAEQQELQPSGAPLSLDMAMEEGGSTLTEALHEGYLDEPVPFVTEPMPRGLWPEARRRLQVAVADVLMKGTRARRTSKYLVMNMDPETRSRTEAEVRQVLAEAQSRGHILEDDPRVEEALLATLFRVLPVQSNEKPQQRRKERTR